MKTQLLPGRYNLIMQTGTIFDIKKYSIHDGPGIRTTVFLKGCPLSCWWCHNPESMSPEPQIAFRAGRCIGCGTCRAKCPNHAITITDKEIATDAESCHLCLT